MHAINQRQTDAVLQHQLLERKRLPKVLKTGTKMRLQTFKKGLRSSTITFSEQDKEKLRQVDDSLYETINARLCSTM